MGIAREKKSPASPSARVSRLGKWATAHARGLSGWALAPSLETVPLATACIGACRATAGVSAMPYTMDVATQVRDVLPSCNVLGAVRAKRRAGGIGQLFGASPCVQFLGRWRLGALADRCALPALPHPTFAGLCCSVGLFYSFVYFFVGRVCILGLTRWERPVYGRSLGRPSFLGARLFRRESSAARPE